MQKLKQLLYSKYSKIILSIVLGFGLATLFNKTCSNKSCYKYIAPDSDKVENNTWLYNNTCYRYKPQISSCDKNKEIIMRS